MDKISEKHKNAIRSLLGKPEFVVFLEFLKVQRDNVAVFEWVRTDYTDPLLREKKAYYQGQRDILKSIIGITQKLAKKDEKE